MNYTQAERQELHSREQKRNDSSPHPCKKEVLCAETSQQIGYTTWVLHNIPHISTVKEEELILLLIMQMMRIGQSEEEEDGHTEEERA